VREKTAGTGSAEASQDALQHLRTRVTGGRGFVAHADTVKDNVFREVKEILRRDVVAAMNDRTGTGRVDQR